MAINNLAAGAVREQQIDVFDFSGEKICTVKAGPRTEALHVKEEIEKSLSIPVREQVIIACSKKLIDNQHLGLDIFKEASEEQRSPQLSFQRLSPEEADLEEGRMATLEEIKHGKKLKDVAEQYKSDSQVVLYAIEHHNGAELQMAGDSVKQDYTTMLEAIRLCTTCMYYVDESLWQNRDFVKCVLAIDGMLLGQKVIPDKFREDVELVMVACESRGFALKFATEELRANRSIVFAAVQQRGTALMYADEELRSDYYVVMDAVRQNRMAIVHALGGLREDDEIRAAAGQGPSDCKLILKVEKIKKKFHELDANGDGFLSYEELESLLRKGNPDLPDDEIRLLYEQLDTHHDGRVDFHEFCDYIFSEDT